jgi:hypothetical protein
MKNRGKMRETERGINLLYNEEENMVLIVLNIVTHRNGQNSLCVINGYKGKAIPLQAWTGSEGSRSLRLPDFKTIGT